MSFPAYPEYKDSGVCHLGTVPSKWDVLPLKRFVQLAYGDALPAEVRDSSGIVNVFGSNGAVGYHVEANTGSPVLLVGRKGSYGALNWSNNTIFAIDTVYYVDSRYCSENLRWVYWALHVANLGGYSQDTGVPGLSRSIAHDTLLPLPTSNEQALIAAFLDHETAKIDALIAEQEKLIELLKEKRQAVISHAVTKGLDPTVPMKDSGVEWLGQVPEHWKVVKLRRVVSEVQTGGTPSVRPPSFDEEDGIDWYTPADFSGAIRLEGASKKLSVEAVKNDRVKMFPKGAVLVVGIGATLGKTGYLTSFASANQQINAILPCDEICGLFLTYSLTTKVAEMRYLSNASTIGIMNQEKTKEIWIAVPPMLEQECIIKYLDADSAANDGLFTESQRAITLLKERRSALISAAVTGKIDVRGYAPQQEAV